MRTVYSAPVVLSSILDSVSRTNFALWFQARLRASEMDQAEFARRYQRVAGLDKAPTGRVSEWATGKRTPSSKSAEFIGEVFGISPRAVLEAAGHLVADIPIDPDDPDEMVVQ